MKKISNIHLSFFPLASPNWIGGEIYQTNLLSAIQSVNKINRPKISLIVKEDTPADYGLRLKKFADEIIQIESRSPSRLQSLLNKLDNRISKSNLFPDYINKYKEAPVSSFLRSRGVDVVFGMFLKAKNFRIPTLSWIPDFQHIHLPEMFSQKEISDRTFIIQQSCTYATRVIVSSECARQDLIEMAPYASPKIIALPFVSHLPKNVYEPNPKYVCKKFKLPAKFFYLPNQFWKHKNHYTVIEALRILHKNRPEISVVCTGPITDYRNPNYFRELLEKRKEYGLLGSFIILGMVPRDDLFQLMRQSMAVLQPSLFEGWSTTVEESKSLGKKIILSDIPVHREQNPLGANYFDASDPDSLADILIDIYENTQPGPDLVLEKAARKALPVRVKLFANEFISIIKLASDTV